MIISDVIESEFFEPSFNRVIKLRVESSSNFQLNLPNELEPSFKATSSNLFRVLTNVETVRTLKATFFRLTYMLKNIFRKN